MPPELPSLQTEKFSGGLMPSPKRKTSTPKQAKPQPPTARPRQKKKKQSELSADELALIAWKITYANHQRGKRLED